MNFYGCIGATCSSSTQLCHTNRAAITDLQKSVMELNLEEGEKLIEECSTLILPALSIGNVGQLAVDLLVASTKAERIGYLDDPNVLPCVGNDAYTPTPQGDLALPLEGGTREKLRKQIGAVAYMK